MYQVHTVAGLPFVATLSGSRAQYSFCSPKSIALKSEREIFICDTQNHCIRLVNEDGSISTIAGSSTSGDSLGVGTKAKFNHPRSIVVDCNDNLLIADTNNQKIKKLSPDGSVTLVAGNGKKGFKDGEPHKARFHRPFDVALDQTGTIVVADCSNHMIRGIRSNGPVFTAAGIGRSGFADKECRIAKFNNPRGVSVMSDGRVFVADTDNHRIRCVHKFQVTTIAGNGLSGLNDGHALKEAQFNRPIRVIVADNERLIISDTANHCIREMTFHDNYVRTLAGCSSAGYVDDLGQRAKFSKPAGICYRSTDGVIFVADNRNHCIRSLTPITLSPNLIETQSKTEATLNELQQLHEYHLLAIANQSTLTPSTNKTCINLQAIGTASLNKDPKVYQELSPLDVVRNSDHVRHDHVFKTIRSTDMSQWSVEDLVKSLGNVLIADHRQLIDLLINNIEEFPLASQLLLSQLIEYLIEYHVNDHERRIGEAKQVWTETTSAIEECRVKTLIAEAKVQRLEAELTQAKIDLIQTRQRELMICDQAQCQEYQPELRTKSLSNELNLKDKHSKIVQEQTTKLVDFQKYLDQEPLERLTSWDVFRWLQIIGLSQYALLFEKHAIDGKRLIKLNERQLEEQYDIEMIGDRKVMMIEIDRLKIRDPIEFKKIYPVDSVMWSWSVFEVVDWLMTLGLEVYEQRFMDQSISGCVLMMLNEEDFKGKLHIIDEDQRSLLVADIQRYRDLKQPTKSPKRPTAEEIRKWIETPGKRNSLTLE